MSQVGQLEVQSSTVVWKIDQFSKRCNTIGQSITSPIFELNDSKRKTYWNLKVYPYGNCSEAENYISLFLTFSSQSSIAECTISYEIGLLCDTQIDKSTLNISLEEKFGSDSSWGWKKFIARNKLYKKKDILLKQDTLTVLCSMKLTAMNKSDKVVGSLADEYESLFNTGDFSDVTIAIGDKLIKAHKAFLSARSRVFSAMLKHDMIENNTNIITITDVEITVMQKFLSFLYSGKINDIDKYAKSLLAVANKYDVQDLKNVCEDSLFDGLTVDNACELVGIAYLYNCPKLQSKIIDFMIENMSDIIDTKGFDDLSNSQPTLFKGIFRKLVKSKNNKKQRVI